MGTFLAATSQALIVGRVSSSSTNPAAPSVHSLSVRNNPAIGRQDISAAQWSADGNRRILIGGSDGASVYDEEGERVEEILKGEMVAAVAVGARTGDTIVAAERIHARSADGKQLAERLEVR